MVSKADYGQQEVNASKTVLVELIHVLGEFRNSIVVVGGSVPPLLFPEKADEYVGTLDVDLAIDPSISENTYESIRKCLLSSGYQESDKQPFIFYRKVTISDSTPITVQVDLLSGEYGGTGKTHRTQKIQDIRARKARGSDLAFNTFEEVEIEAELPNGGLDKVKCRIAGIVPFLVMKGMALASRMKEKDAWDIYFCLLHFPGGLEKLVEEFRPFAENKLVVEGLSNIGEKFQSPDHIGPKNIVDFENITDEEENDRIKRDAYERVHFLLSKLGLW